MNEPADPSRLLGAYSQPTAPPAAPSEAPGRGPVRLEGVRILLVDDSYDTVLVLAELLRTRGLNVRHASRVDEAMREASADLPDLILTDIGMPDLDGYDFLGLLRADERLKTIPVIAATGYVGSAEQMRMADVGFAAALSKPFDLEELLRTLEQVHQQ
jgi:two-component system CheB/CheR fusion protein